MNAISKMLPITTADRIPADERAKIDAAIPRQALAKPRQARKLLIIDVCPAGGFYHNTVAHGNLMLQLIAKYTGAYEPIFDNNLENLRYPHIKQYDAVFLNSVVGPVFSDPEVLDGLIRYVSEGGGVAGLHGTTFASQDRARVRRVDGRAGRPAPVQRRARHAEDRRSRQPADEALRRQGIFDDGRVLSLPDDRARTRARSCTCC